MRKRTERERVEVCPDRPSDQGHLSDGEKEPPFSVPQKGAGGEPLNKALGWGCRGGGVVWGAALLPAEC